MFLIQTSDLVWILEVDFVFPLLQKEEEEEKTTRSLTKKCVGKIFFPQDEIDSKHLWFAYKGPVSGFVGDIPLPTLDSKI